jgi:hypothetical protein
MKKIFVATAALLLFSIILTSCGANVPRPEIKEGRFNISVTYEHNGEIKTVSGVYVCEYEGVNWWDINADPYANWKGSYEGDIQDSGIIPICNTDDDGEIFISLLMYPEYFMGDPEYANYTPLIRAELWYPDEQTDDIERIAEHGVKLISYEYDEPIENSYK